jgi:mono/diheme cytochrome c family protein
MKATKNLILMSGVVLAFGTAILAQQHSYTQAEVDAGSKLYDSNCGSCHGENGDKVTGIDFSKSTFKTARTDDDIARIARNGVPNTGMPPNPGINADQANNLVAFLRSLVGGRTIGNVTQTALAGDPTRGKAIFEGKGNCTSCHAINGAGGTSGPDLGGARGGGGGGRGAFPAIPGAGGPPAGAPPAAAGAPPAAGGGRGAGGGGRGGAGGGRGAGAPPAGGAPGAPPVAAQGPRGGGGGGGARGGGANAPNPAQIERSIVDPSAEIAAQYRVYQVVTKANVTAKGTLLNQDTFSIQMRDGNDKLLSYWKTDLKDFGFQPSPMPSYKDKLSPQEIADVVSYLVSLRSN